MIVFASLVWMALAPLWAPQLPGWADGLLFTIGICQVVRLVFVWRIEVRR